MTPLEQEFEEDMLNIYEQAKRYKYYPNYFVQMVHEHHGVGAAQRLLAKPDFSQGLTKLWELGRLDLSMEALVVREQYAPLFTQEEIAVAQKRLDELGFKGSAFIAPSKKPKGKTTENVLPKRAQVPPTDESLLAARIKNGESANLEFKVAACWNSRTRKKDDTMKDNVLQALASFLNSYTPADIIIGVENGTNAIVGLENDYQAANSIKKDKDGYELWLRNVIASALGADVTSFYDTHIYQLEGKDILRIHVNPSPKPFYLDGDLYIRDGNGKRKLKTVDAYSYIKQRWGI